VIGRPALSPTNPDGRNGQHRLAAQFTEWMMGWPAGWVTDPAIGLTRNEQLKACGNGVVTAQALLALQVLA
jgi:DNA (cytosine-5)-methyltransferase 1